MANYLRSGDARKQRILLQSRMDALSSRIKAGRPVSELAKAAVGVRHAKLQVIKGLIHEIDPARTEDMTPERLGRIRRLLEEAAKWKLLTV